MGDHCISHVSAIYTYGRALRDPWISYIPAGDPSWPMGDSVLPIYKYTNEIPMSDTCISYIQTGDPWTTHGRPLGDPWVIDG